MKYAKPEIRLMASATAAIQGQGKVGQTLDSIPNQTHTLVSAYEADE